MFKNMMEWKKFVKNIGHGFNMESTFTINQEDTIKPLYDRFDLEQQIMSCWTITDDLKILNESILEGGTVDENANICTGLQALYDKKFEKLFSIFEYLIHTKKIT